MLLVLILFLMFTSSSYCVRWVNPSIQSASCLRNNDPSSGVSDGFWEIEREDDDDKELTDA